MEMRPVNERQTAYPNFRTDPRVHAGMTTCLQCHAELPDREATTGTHAIVMFVQCAVCKVTYILDSMTSSDVT